MNLHDMLFRNPLKYGDAFGWTRGPLSGRAPGKLTDEGLNLQGKLNPWFTSGQLKSANDVAPYIAGAIFGGAALSGAGAGGAGAAEAGAGGAEAGGAAEAGTTASSTSPAWKEWARMGSNMMRTSNQPQQPPRPQTGNVPLEEPTMASSPTYFNPNTAPGQPGQSGMYDLMLSLSDLGSQEKNLNKQYALAEEMRGTPMPDLRSNGRVSRAAHPLEFLNSTIRQGMGYSERNKAMKGQEAMAAEIRRRIQEERARQQQGQQGMPITPQQYNGYPDSPYMET